MDRIEKAICKALLPTLQLHGFELHKEWGYFVRKQAYGFDALLVVNQGTAKGRFFEIKCHAEIRHDHIEVPWNTLGLVYGEDNQQQTWTLLYKDLAGRNAEPMKVVPESMAADVAHVSQQVAELFVHMALPFYARFADLREVEEWVNKTPLADANPTAGGPMEDRAFHALLLAKAVNPSRYASIREAFITLDQGMFPRDKRMAMLQRVDEIQL